MGKDVMTARILVMAVFFFAVALNATTTVRATSSSPPQKTVVEECTENWQSSAADATCSNESIVKVMNYRCRITADCQISSGGTNNTWKTVERYDADRLVNCNGILRLDNC